MRDIVVDERGCWIFPQETGTYGLITIGRERLSAHRVSYELFVGPIAPGHTLDWKCGNWLCINWAHLVQVPRPPARPGPDGVWNKRRTHCRHGHQFTPENTYYYRDRRCCRACRREHDRWPRKHRERSRPQWAREVSST